MNTLEKIEKEGWYGYNDYYIDMDGYHSVLFDNFHNRAFYADGQRLGALHGQTHDHTHSDFYLPVAVLHADYHT